MVSQSLDKGISFTEHQGISGEFMRKKSLLSPAESDAPLTVGLYILLIIHAHARTHTYTNIS